MAVDREDLARITQQAGKRLPYWARSTNPIVRRHLGLGWRTVPPELRPMIIGVLIWMGALIAGFMMPFVLNMVMMVFIASILVMPFTVFLYGHLLVDVVTRTASIMQEELRNKTLPLLMTTPMTLEQIFLGKIAAALWTRIDDLVAVAQLSVYFGPPILFSTYSTIWTPEAQPIALLGVMAVSMVVSLVRLILEPVMFGVIAVVVGIVVPYRSTAITSALTLGAFYVLLLNMLPFLPGVTGQAVPLLIVSIVLPVVLPVVIIAGGLLLAHMIVTQD